MGGDLVLEPESHGGRGAAFTISLPGESADRGVGPDSRNAGSVRSGVS
jgi:hypothetical protein